MAALGVSTPKILSNRPAFKIFGLRDVETGTSDFVLCVLGYCFAVVCDLQCAVIFFLISIT